MGSGYIKYGLGIIKKSDKLLFLREELYNILIYKDIQ